MAYTAQQMAAHAELHYRSASNALARAEDSTTPTARGMNTMTAIAEAQAGLLAMALADYAMAPLTEDEL